MVGRETIVRRGNQIYSGICIVVIDNRIALIKTQDGEEVTGKILGYQKI
jgi:hypothetical protein